MERKPESNPLPKSIKQIPKIEPKKEIFRLNDHRSIEIPVILLSRLYVLLLLAQAQDPPKHCRL